MKFIRNDYYEKHIATHEEATNAPTEEAPIEAPIEEAPKEDKIPEEVVVTTISDEVTLTFSKPVEITINGKQYFGTEVVAPNMMIASEIVRIAREAYGRSILA
jgi:hypothetical protein